VPELLAAALLLVSLAGLVSTRGLFRQGAVVAAELHRCEALLAERERIEALRAQMGQVQQLAETAVDGTTSVVRAVHQGIAAIPFGILEAIPATRDTTRVVRSVHDAIAGAVYGSIRGVNKLIGRAAREALAEKPPAPPDANKKP
jgi:hypothetical protein